MGWRRKLRNECSIDEGAGQVLWEGPKSSHRKLRPCH